MGVFLSEQAYIAAWKDKKGFHATKFGRCALPLFRGKLFQEQVDPRDPFEIAIKAVHENRIQHVAGDLTKRRSSSIRIVDRFVPYAFVANRNDKCATRSEVYRRAQRRTLTNRSITEILLSDLDRRKNHRHGDGGHQVFDSNGGRTTLTPGSIPTHQSGVALKKSD